MATNPSFLDNAFGKGNNMDASVYSWFSPIFVGERYLNDLLLSSLLASGFAFLLAGALAYLFPKSNLWRNMYGAALLLVIWIVGGITFTVAALLVPIMAKSRNEKKMGRFFGMWAAGLAFASLAWMSVPVSVQYVSLQGLEISTKQQEHALALHRDVVFYGVEAESFDPSTLVYNAYTPFDEGPGATLWSVTGVIALQLWQTLNPDTPLDYTLTVAPGDRLVRLDLPRPERGDAWPVVYCLYDQDLSLRSVRTFLSVVDPNNDPKSFQDLCPSAETVRALPATADPSRLFPFGKET